MTNQITELTIDRATWACKPNNDVREGYSEMRDRDGFKCCLGFLAEACGIESTPGIHTTPASYTSDEMAKLPVNFRPIVSTKGRYNGYGSLYSGYDDNTDLANSCIQANDEDLDNKVRESTLKGLFQQAGIKLTFHGKYLAESVYA